jgi:predicted Rossmann fold nucleotide-binding protein DprA/Smf involved in DNA uptake
LSILWWWAGQKGITESVRAQERRDFAARRVTQQENRKLYEQLAAFTGRLESVERALSEFNVRNLKIVQDHAAATTPGQESPAEREARELDGRILQKLEAAELTINRLARNLEVKPACVKTRLEALEREGLVSRMDGGEFWTKRTVVDEAAPGPLGR